MKDFFVGLWNKIKPKKVIRKVYIDGKKIKVPRDNQTVLTKRKGVERVIFGTVCVFFTIYALALLYPLFYLIVNSLEDTILYSMKEMQGKALELPKKLHFSNYVKVFSELNYEDVNFFEMLFNTLFYTFIPTAYGLLWPTLNGYVFAKFNFKAKGVLYAIAITCMTLPIMGTGGAAFKLRLDLGMYDNRWAFIIGATGSFDSRWLILLGIFKGIPWSYAEAVYIDGGNDFTVFFRIMLPQALPAIAVLYITAAENAWNDYASMLLYHPSDLTLATGLYYISSQLQRTGGHTIYYAGLVLSALPFVIIYMFSCESMMKNVSIGGLKG